MQETKFVSDLKGNDRNHNASILSPNDSFISGNVLLPQSNVTVIWIVQTPRTNSIVPQERFLLRVCLQQRHQLLHRHLLMLLQSQQQRYPLLLLKLLHQQLQRKERTERIHRLRPSFPLRFLQSHLLRLRPSFHPRFLQSHRLLQLAQNGLPYGGYAS